MTKWDFIAVICYFRPVFTGILEEIRKAHLLIFSVFLLGLLLVTDSACRVDYPDGGGWRS